FRTDDSYRAEPEFAIASPQRADGGGSCRGASEHRRRAPPLLLRQPRRGGGRARLVHTPYGRPTPPAARAVAAPPRAVPLPAELRPLVNGRGNRAAYRAGCARSVQRRARA